MFWCKKGLISQKVQRLYRHAWARYNQWLITETNHSRPKLITIYLVVNKTVSICINHHEWLSIIINCELSSTIVTYVRVSTVSTIFSQNEELAPAMWPITWKCNNSPTSASFSDGNGCGAHPFTTRHWGWSTNLTAAAPVRQRRFSDLTPLPLFGECLGDA